MHRDRCRQRSRQSEMIGGNMWGRGRDLRSGLLSQGRLMGIRTQKPLLEGPAEGGDIGEVPLGPHAHKRPLRNRTGPPNPASTPLPPPHRHHSFG